MEAVKYSELNQFAKRVTRDSYVRHQEGRCCHCQVLLTLPPPANILKLKLNMRLFPPGFLRWPVHLHHCHKTDLTIGAVHAYCNGVLWQYHGE